MLKRTFKIEELRVHMCSVGCVLLIGSSEYLLVFYPPVTMGFKFQLLRRTKGFYGYSNFK